MALVEIIENSRYRVGLWSITETPSELLSLAALSKAEQALLEKMATEKRRRQWLAVRVLLQTMDHTARQHLCYTADGKPLLGDLPAKVSISHSGDMAAVQLSAGDGYCGIDIQAGSHKIERLAEKFAHADELAFIPPAQNSEGLNLIWTMKEAVFKHYGSGLAFKDQIRIAPFDLHTPGVVQAWVERDNQKHALRLHWRRINEYFLSYLC